MSNRIHPEDCPHEEEVIIVLSAAAGVETIADKCQGCGRITNKRTET